MTMSARRIIGAALVIVGVLALLWGGISWTHDETVVDAGPIEIEAEKHERIPLPPVVGGIAVVGGLVLLLLPDRRRA
jgi:drug/metabolite transporter (DMT)-like permease